MVVFPKGWFHWFVAETDDVYVLTIFDQPTPDIVFGADFLAATPPEVAHRAYCLDEDAYAKAVASIQNDAILGPNVGVEQTFRILPCKQLRLPRAQGNNVINRNFEGMYPKIKSNARTCS